MTNKRPLKGMVILKRLNTKESEAGVDLKSLEYVFASDMWAEIVKHLIVYPKHRRSWLIVAQFEKNADGDLEYSNGMSADDFLKEAYKHLESKTGKIILN